MSNRFYSRLARATGQPTASAVARALELEPRTVLRWQNGSSPTLARVAALAQALGVPAPYLAYGSTARAVPDGRTWYERMYTLASRGAGNLGVRELALVVEHGHSTLLLWRDQPDSARIRSVDKIARRLGVAPAFLAFGAGTSTDPYPPRRQLELRFPRAAKLRPREIRRRATASRAAWRYREAPVCNLCPRPARGVAAESGIAVPRCEEHMQVEFLPGPLCRVCSRPLRQRSATGVHVSCQAVAS